MGALDVLMALDHGAEGVDEASVEFLRGVEDVHSVVTDEGDAHPIAWWWRWRLMSK